MFRPSIDSRTVHSSEDGFLSFVSCVVVLFGTLLVATVFNIGSPVKQKIELQNAADASILSSMSMTARGMNAVTLTNHMLGELTALMVIHEALGGTELDDNVEKGDRRQSSSMSAALNAALIGLQNAGITYNAEFGSLDRQTADRLKKDGGDKENSGGEHLAFATIFDCRLTLKYYMCEVYVGRAVANLCRFIPFGIGEVIYWAINIPLTVVVAKMFQEILIIDGVEQIAKVFSRPKRQIIERRVLPFMENYGEACVKQIPVAAAKAAEQTAERNGVKLHLYPAQVKLPLELEPKPPQSQLGGGREPRAGNASSPADIVSKVLDVIGSASDALDTAASLFGLDDDIPSFSGPSPGNDGYPAGQNLSRDSLPKLSQQQWSDVERSQWTRAAYPYVQGWRKPIREWFAGVLLVSRGGTWYSRWTNRYTVAKSYQYRNGQYGGQKGQDALAMYVMQDAPQSGKGLETWTKNNEQAEQLFTQIAFVQKPGKAPIAPVIFGSAPEDGLVAYSQAIFYNANNQSIPANKNVVGRLQPELGWDTLNWTPGGGSRAFEFLQGDEASMRITPPPIPFIMFNKAQEHPQVRLNWQAKLTPTTRYGEARRSAVRMPSEIRSVLLKQPLDLDAFQTH
ncbi:MAG: hypothetical protein JNL96_24250 [Planctomycetaceae bacterium]|nr:hypothetical protein [Planctomycetaceae bacterium]